ncbi:MAG: ABC1 kinase family protein [Actinomycetota bacterium]
MRHSARAPLPATAITGRDRRARVVTVAALLVRHAASHLVDLTRSAPTPAARRARRVRLLIEDLGATATKIGQIASTRPDVLAPEYITELSKLQDAAPPEAPEVIAAVITHELGAPPTAVYTSFDPRPIAAASIGQAHAAVYHDGTPVVVKIRRPGVVAQIDVDLDILDRASRAISRVSRAARRYDLLGLTRQFAGTLRAELDYTVEAANARRFAEEFAGRRDLQIPRVYPDLSTHRVITLERCFGVKPDDLDALRAAGVDLPALAHRCADIMLTMIFEHGFFHADPHAGNFFVAPDGTVGLIDFGMVGVLDAGRRSALAQVMTAVATGDVDRLADAALSLGMTTGPLDRAGLLRDFATLVHDHLDLPLGELRVGELLLGVMGTMRRHRLRLPVDLALLAKTFAMSEGLAARLDPDFRMAPAVLEHVQRFVMHPGAAPEPNRPPGG